MQRRQHGEAGSAWPLRHSNERRVHSQCQRGESSTQRCGLRSSVERSGRDCCNSQSRNQPVCRLLCAIVLQVINALQGFCLLSISQLYHGVLVAIMCMLVDICFLCYLRRLCFTPDGLLLITPAGIHRPPADKAAASATTSSSASSSVADKGRSGGPSSASGAAGAAKSFCTHIFSRNALATPCASLVGLEDPSVAVRCCPRLFTLLQSPSGQVDTPYIPGEYR